MRAASPPGTGTDDAGAGPAAGAALDRVIAFYATLSPDTLAGIDRLYAPDAGFKDPFNEVRGTAAITAVFLHMFATTQDPRFEVLDAAGDHRQGFLTWDFRFRSLGPGARDWRIHGATRLAFAPDGRIVLHRDYWDPAEEIYQHLPVLGPLMRWLRARLTADRARPGPRR